ncbi:alpha/beta fold hydrolase [Aquibacillus saliphilus]|uniref:alpha/beta fold hydrolase n=1 Tax=Aquibacillus saliphilus TaxID=1909422 RepID=UPI001CEFF4A4|nr:alpha/beta hydrolase [Aquibacillus saliphilus]
MKSIQYENGTVYYETNGNGVPIIFIHPPGMGRRVFDKQQQLSDKYLIVTPDFSGHGLSSSSIEYSIIDNYVEELKLIIDNEKFEQAIICGYSAGGVIAQEFAKAYPTKTQALILSGGYPKVATIGLKIEYKLGMRLFKKSPETLARFLSISHTKDKEYRKVLYSHMLKSDFAHWYKFYDQTLHYNGVTDLDSLDMPLLLIYGANAFWINRHKIYYERCANHHVVYIDKAYHQLPTKHWQPFNQIISEFINTKVI